MFRPGLLETRRIAWAADDQSIAAFLRRLGATVAPVEGEDEEALQAWVADNLPLHAHVLDAAASFGVGGPGALTGTLERAWVMTRAVATGALIPARSGRLILVAPRWGAGPHAEAARAGLENLARTLSVEWARFGLTAVAITPGAGTTSQEVATLVAFLVSEAGGYFSGCRFDLGLAAPSPFISAS